MPKTSQTKKTKPADIDNDSIKQEDVASKLDTIVELLSLILKELVKNKSPFAE